MARKRGAHHSRIAVMPLGMKRTGFDFALCAAILALEHNKATKKHLVDMYALAEFCEALNIDKKLAHITTHVENVKRLCNEVHLRDCQCTRLVAASLIASASVLIPWFSIQPNKRIADFAHVAIHRINARTD